LHHGADKFAKANEWDSPDAASEAALLGVFLSADF
jgi:hypothetical protein